MAGVTNGLVVHSRYAAAVSLAERSQPTRGIECFVTRAIDFDFLEPFERQDVNFLSINNALAKIAVLIDYAVS